MKDIRASVAMAVYNGDKYISEQISSILELMGPNDELIISDDHSQDNTRKIVERYSKIDARVKLYINEHNSGVSGNFTNAVSKCSGKYIFLSDQDDVWMNNKIEKSITLMDNSRADLVIHNGRLADEELNPYGESLFDLTNATVSPLRNLVKGRFLGCCMCFRRECFEYILPFPEITTDFPHDIYATILVGMRGKIVMLNEIMIFHRMHGGNATPKQRNNFLMLIVKRSILLYSVIFALIRSKRRINSNE